MYINKFYSLNLIISKKRQKSLKQVVIVQQGKGVLQLTIKTLLDLILALANVPIVDDGLSRLLVNMAIVSWMLGMFDVEQI